MTALDTVDGLHVYDYEKDLPVLPAAVVRMPNRIDPRAVLGGGSWDYSINVLLLISRGSDRGADAQLEAFLAQTGSGSIVVALRVDATLGGVCASADIAEVTEFGYVILGTESAMSCSLVVEVMT